MEERTRVSEISGKNSSGFEQVLVQHSSLGSFCPQIKLRSCSFVSHPHKYTLLLFLQVTGAMLSMTSAFSSLPVLLGHTILSSKWWQICLFTFAALKEDENSLISDLFFASLFLPGGLAILGWFSWVFMHKNSLYLMMFYYCYYLILTCTIKICMIRKSEENQKEFSR